jgi:hypothetical protein
MTTDRELDEILAEIGREHRAIGAPDKLEPVLCAAAGSRKNAIGTPGLRFAWTWAAVVILLTLVATAGIIWQTRRSHPLQNQQVRSVPVPQVRPEPMLPSARVTGRQSVQSQSVQSTSAPVWRSGTGRTSLRDSSLKQATTWNSLDEFVPLPVSEGLPPAAELSVVRINLRGSDLQQYGLEAPADAVAQTMSAEFVVGEDGLPRAIRIVR